MEKDQQIQLSPRYDPHEVEGAILDFWEKGGYSHARIDDPAEVFSIVIPPPNVTGFLHMGHAFNSTLQDILIRWKRMQGFNTLWVPGTDHAGIATQHVVEKNLWNEEKMDRRDLGREKFLERVWDWKDQYEKRILGQLKRLGSSCDWTRTRFTLDDGLSRAVRTVFKQLYDEGLIYQDDYLVNWSPALQTTLSDDEVEHKDINGHLWHFRYPLEDGSGFVQVATTRPETMLGDTAVAVHPDDDRYTAIHSARVRLPLMDRLIPVITDDFVDREFGTGAVKVTPAHDPNDYQMGRRHDLEFINLLNPDGTLNDNAGPYESLTVKEARKRVIADLDELKCLVKVEDHQHAIGHCYRSGCVIEPYMSKQWFVKMPELCKPAIDAVRDKRTTFEPGHYEKIYFHWLENVRDWPISRQLWWGHRIPIWHCDDCGGHCCIDDGEPGSCPHCKSTQLHQDPDVLDTWFSSALWPFSTLGWPDQSADLGKYYPTSALVTGFDIIFFWVARMMIMGLKFMGDVPFRKVVINPIVRDEHGFKMSKSLGNAIDPLEVIREIGADSIRSTLASYSIQNRNINLSEKRLETYRNFNNKLWNAARFVLGNTEDLDAACLAAGVAEDNLQLEDKWILARTRLAVDEITKALEGWKFDVYMDLIFKFTRDEYCAWYIELVKDRLNEQSGKGNRQDPGCRTIAQVVLITVLEQITRLLHPVAPFISEEIWQKLKSRWGSAFSAHDSHTLSLSSDALMVAAWPGSGPGSGSACSGSIKIMNLIQNVIGRIRNIRGEMNIPPASGIDVEITSSNTGKLETIQKLKHHLESLVTINRLEFGAETILEGFTATGAVEDLTIHVYLPADLLDHEKKRLEKEIVRLEKGVNGTEKKLQNEKFIQNARPEVIEKEKERLDLMKGELASLVQRRNTFS
jgi:valyl-tRNA synthetase